MENSALIGWALPNVRVIMTIIRVLVVELLCHTVKSNCLFYYDTLKCLIVLLMPCMKWKPRKNITKAWFLVEKYNRRHGGRRYFISTHGFSNNKKEPAEKSRLQRRRNLELFVWFKLHVWFYVSFGNTVLWWDGLSFELCHLWEMLVIWIMSHMFHVSCELYIYCYNFVLNILHECCGKEQQNAAENWWKLSYRRWEKCFLERRGNSIFLLCLKRVKYIISHIITGYIYFILSMC
jgi:hypothetical protein